jgi:hypothetical protein
MLDRTTEFSTRRCGLERSFRSAATNQRVMGSRAGPASTGKVKDRQYRWCESESLSENTVLNIKRMLPLPINHVTAVFTDGSQSFPAAGYDARTNRGSH